VGRSADEQEEKTTMNQHRQGFNILGHWFTVFEVRVIIIVMVTFIGGLAGILTGLHFLVPAMLCLIFATAWYLLFKRIVR
jgi:hypothetical protein